MGSARRSRPSTTTSRPSARECGECQACCTTYHIDGLPEESPRWVPCHMLGERGCSIYADRPQGCVQFRCAWLDGWGAEEDRPDRLGVVVELLPARPRIDVPARAIVTELEPGAAARGRTAGVVRSLRDGARKVVLVPFRARGFENFGKELPEDF